MIFFSFLVNSIFACISFTKTSKETKFNKKFYTILATNFLVAPFVLGLQMSIYPILFEDLSGKSLVYLTITIPILLTFLQFKKIKTIFARIERKKPCINFFLISSLLITFSLITFKVQKSMELPLKGHDALVYANEAKFFANHRGLEGIPSFINDLKELTPSHPHLFFHQALLSIGFFNGCNDKSANYQCDTQVKLVSKILLYYLYSAIFLFFFSILSFPKALLAFNLGLLLHILHYFNHRNGVDGYRILAIFQFYIMVFQLLFNNKNISKRNFFFSFLIGLSGHTLNILFINLAIFALAIYKTAFEKEFSKLRKLKIIEIAILSNIIIGSFYLLNYLRTGNFMGFGFYYYAYLDTPYWEKFLEYRTQTQSIGIFDKIWGLIKFRGSWPSTVSTVLSIGYLALYKKVHKVLEIDKVTKNTLNLIILIGLTQYLMVIGIFDVMRVNLSNILIMNKRYFTPWFIFQASIIAIILPIFLNKFIQKFKTHLFVMVQISIAVLSFRSIYKWQTDLNDAGPSGVTKITSKLPNNSKFMLGTKSLHYYIDQESIDLIDFKYWEITKAKSLNDFIKAIKKFKVTHFLFQTRIYDDCWKYYKFDGFLHSDKFKTDSFTENGEKYILFTLIE